MMRLAGLIILVALILGGGCGSANQLPVISNGNGDNRPPVIDEVILEYSAIERGGTGGVKCKAHDPDGDRLTYTWRATRGGVSGDGPDVTYTAPNSYVDDVVMTVFVTDGRGGGTDFQVTFSVVCCSYAQKNPEWLE